MCTFPGSVPTAARAALTLLTVLTPLAAQDPPLDAPDVARLRALGTGAYPMQQQGLSPPTSTDFAIAIRGLADEPAVTTLACRALHTLFAQDFAKDLATADRHRIGRAVVTAVTADDPDLASAARIALRDLARLPRADDQASIASEDLRRLVIGAADQLEQGSLLQRRTAAQCMVDVAPTLDPPLRTWILRGLLRGLEDVEPGPDATPEFHERQQTRRWMKTALATIPAPDAPLATEVVTELLPEVAATGVNPFVFWSRGTVLSGLARQLPQLDGELRETVLAALLGNATDPDNAYMPTSGRISPLRHAGLDALALALPALNEDERARAKEARDQLRATADAWTAEGAKDAPLPPNLVDISRMFDAFDAAWEASR